MKLPKEIHPLVKSLVPKAMLLIYPLYAGIAYFITHQELLTPDFSSQESGIPVFDDGPNYLIFIGIFILSGLLWAIYHKFLRAFIIAQKNKYNEEIELSLVMLDLVMISNIAMFGLVYTFLFGFYLENLLFWIIPFLFHIKFLQENNAKNK